MSEQTQDSMSPEAYKQRLSDYLEQPGTKPLELCTAQGSYSFKIFSVSE